MPTCTRCGADNRPEARFCDSCGSPLAAAPPERRKLATLVFCDMSGSTAMGERVDAESVREMMFSYFHTMRGAIEGHGGTVEKFIGDAVVAVFGVPVAHEDDALRAVRAAAEMQRRLGDLNEELLRRYGSTIALRIGVNTGEVVAGDPSSRQTFVTGDAVNVAARLEQAARPGEVLLGEATYRLVRHAVAVEPVEPIAAKGKAEPVPAYRLLRVEEAAPAQERRLDAPIVGREEELAVLLAEYGRSREERCCRLATVVGEAGVGKSRLAEELLAGVVPEARVLRGRCLSYGEGITLWPLREIVTEAAGIRDEHAVEEARARIERLVAGDDSAELVAERVAQAIGLTGGAAPPEEIAWALRRLLGALALERPLVLLVDDIHWAEPALLELLLDLPASLRDVPVFVLCLSRPDLLDIHADWSVAVRLEALGEAETSRLLESLLGGQLDAGVRARVLAAADGNPLFVEELVAMLVEGGELQRERGMWRATRSLSALAIPPTLSALLGARLDRLAGSERSALERASVEGQVFHRGAVVDLSPADERDRVAERLRALAGRALVREAPATFAGEAAFRFRHILIRDAAYAAAAKKLRAELHERLADWLERMAGDRVGEYEEILGYHLEQAYRYRAELGVVGEPGAQLARRAALNLAAAGRRALARQDVRAATGLLERARQLWQTDDLFRVELGLALARARVLSGAMSEAASELDDVIAAARRHGESRLEWSATLDRALLGALTEPARWTVARLEDVARQGLGVFEASGDEAGLAQAWGLLALVALWSLRTAEAVAAAQRSIEYARRAGDALREADNVMRVVMALSCGSTSASELAEACEDMLEWRLGNLHSQAAARSGLALARAMQGRFEEARTLAAESVSVLAELGLDFYAGGETFIFSAPIERLADDMQAAERHLRRGLDLLERVGEIGGLSTAAGFLAHLLALQHRDDEAERYVETCREAAAPDDVLSQVLWRCAAALVLLHRGSAEEAERTAADAVALALETDDLDRQAEALVTQAHVLGALGKEGASEAIERARALYERRENVVMAARCAGLLERLG